MMISFFFGDEFRSKEDMCCSKQGVNRLVILQLFLLDKTPKIQVVRIHGGTK